MGDKKHLDKAKNVGNDEFYTLYGDVEKELSHYTEHFKDRVMYLNCESGLPKSAFEEYFTNNFQRFGLKKLIVTKYKQGGYVYSVENDEVRVETINDGSSDFSYTSDVCIELLKQSDIVVTNPPFSRFREFINLMYQYDKKYIVLGCQNAITYIDVYNRIKNNTLSLGINNGNTWFRVPDDTEERRIRYKCVDGVKYISLGNACWFTNLDIHKQKGLIEMTETINRSEGYERYDNYNGIEVPNLVSIPFDYDGVMGVPITFLHKYNPEQFEIVGFRKGDDGKDLSINGKPKYFRVLIRKR